jgi:hypothetical protein
MKSDNKLDELAIEFTEAYARWYEWYFNAPIDVVGTRVGRDLHDNAMWKLANYLIEKRKVAKPIRKSLIKSLWDFLKSL